MKKLVIDNDKCISCGTCVALCPKTFEMEDNMKAHVKNPLGDSEDDIQNAINSCPTQAISWEGQD